jgi:acylphosphatase
MRAAQAPDADAVSDDPGSAKRRGSPRRGTGCGGARIGADAVAHRSGTHCGQVQPRITRVRNPDRQLSVLSTPARQPCWWHDERVIARQVRIHGDVQGVSFRATCHWEAETRGVTGWARNELDGTVSAWFEGEPEAVEAMIEWCRRGPGAAQVTTIEVQVVAPQGRWRFDVR